MMAAVARSDHRLVDAPPWVLDDPFALVLVGPVWREVEAAVRTQFREHVVREAVAGVVTRSRYAEDRLLAGSFSQYVILGAGLDSFAWRRPDLLRSVRVFEVDHPASQAWKRQRVADLALPVADGHVFAPIVEAIIHSCGLRPIEHPTREDLIDRYFAERADRLKPYTTERLLAALVPG